MKVQELLNLVREYPMDLEVVCVHQGRVHTLTAEHIYPSVEDGVLNIGPGEPVDEQATSDDAPDGGDLVRIDIQDELKTKTKSKRKAANAPADVS